MGKFIGVTYDDMLVLCSKTSKTAWLIFNVSDPDEHQETWVLQ